MHACMSANTASLTLYTLVEVKCVQTVAIVTMGMVVKRNVYKLVFLESILNWLPQGNRLQFATRRVGANWSSWKLCAPWLS